MRIGFCYNVKRHLPSTDPKAQVDAEFDSPNVISTIKKALESGGHQVHKIEANQQAYLKLYKLRRVIDIVFNIAEGSLGDAREAQIPAMCDMLDIPYTFSSTLTHAVKLNKALTKKLLIYHGIKTAKFQLFENPHQKLDNKLRFPLIVKPNSEGSSKGIFNENFVKNIIELQRRLKWMFNNFSGSILVEEYLSGREFTVALLDHPPQVLPIVEQNLQILPKQYLQFASYEVKWLWEDTLTDAKIAYSCPAKISKKLADKLHKISLATFNVLNCKDAARVDIRLDHKGVPHVLEINTLPGMMPDKNVVSYLPIAARAAGYNFNKMVLAILNSALKRYGLLKQASPKTSHG